MRTISNRIYFIKVLFKLQKKTMSNKIKSRYRFLTIVFYKKIFSLSHTYKHIYNIIYMGQIYIYIFFFFWLLF